MIKKNDIVMVIGCESVFSDLLGCFGIVKENLGEKSLVMFKGGVNGMGSLSHTVLNSELLKVGEGI